MVDIAGVILLGLFAIIYLGGMAWVWWDAKSQNRHAMLWAVGMLVLWLPTLIAYILIAYRHLIFSKPGDSNVGV